MKILYQSTFFLFKCKCVNVVHDGQIGTILLENPADSGSLLNLNQLCDEIQSLFGISSTKCGRLHEQVKEMKGIDSLTGQTLYTDASKVNPSLSSTNGSLCPFVDITCEGKSVTLLLENPVGRPVTEYLAEVVATLFGKSVQKLKVGCEVMELRNMKLNDWANLNGKVVSLLK